MDRKVVIRFKFHESFNDDDDKEKLIDSFTIRLSIFFSRKKTFFNDNFLSIGRIILFSVFVFFQQKKPDKHDNMNISLNIRA